MQTPPGAVLRPGAFCLHRLRELEAAFQGYAAMDVVLRACATVPVVGQVAEAVSAAVGLASAGAAVLRGCGLGRRSMAGLNA